MTNLRICTVGLDHNWWFLTTFLMFFLWFSWFIAPETDSKKITKIIGILPNALELGCQKLSKKCTGINLRGKAGSRTNPEVFKIHRCLCFRVCMGQCCQRLVIKFLSRGVSLLLAAYHSQKAVGREPPATTFHGDFPWFYRSPGFGRRLEQDKHKCPSLRVELLNQKEGVIWFSDFSWMSCPLLLESSKPRNQSKDSSLNRIRQPELHSPGGLERADRLCFHKNYDCGSTERPTRLDGVFRWCQPADMTVHSSGE